MHPTSVALLTGGGDKPYAIGLAAALATRVVSLDFIGSDELDCPDVHAIPNLTFFNLRGDQREDVGLLKKAARVLLYYARLLRYAATAKPPILHVLWNNKFELFDRTVLLTYYWAVGKRIVLTAHNVNGAARDGRDSWLNRVTLRIQYRLCDHVFVHTDAMKRELISTFGMTERRVTVIPFGINDTIPKTALTSTDARRSLGIADGERALLFFGQIAPYKGLEYLVAAVASLAQAGFSVRLIIAGKVKRGSEEYWRDVQQSVVQWGLRDVVVQSIKFIPDEAVENYLKAADAVVIPYVDIFQSGVPFLAFSFGVPVIATDVGSLRDDIISETGLLCRPKDVEDLARAITEFYQSALHEDKEGQVRARIRRFAVERHSWETVAERTEVVYASLARGHRRTMSGGPNAGSPADSLDHSGGNSAHSSAEPVLRHRG